MKQILLKKIDAIESKIIQKTMKSEPITYFVELEGENYIKKGNEIIRGDDMNPIIDEMNIYQAGSSLKVTFRD